MEKMPQVTEEMWEGVCEFNRELMEEFLYNSTELSPQTINTYTSNLRIWFNWVKENLGNKKQVEIKPLEYLRFQNMLVRKGHSSSDINIKRSAISSLNNYILVYHEEFTEFRNFINKGVKKPEKSFVNEKVPPTKAEMQMLIETLEARGDWQKVAYLKFTWETGCRRAESMQLMKDIVNAKPISRMVKTKDENGDEIEKEVVYYKTPEIRCKGKGATGKQRKLKFTDYSMDAIKKWLEIRGEDDCEYMFITKWKGEIKQVSLTTFNQWAKNTFTPILGRRFHPHILRESRATTSVVEDGKSIESVQNLLGHASSETTQIYIIKDEDDEASDELFC